ncbi:MAG: hypothetical protein ABSG69_05690 [Candidatus Acidiferrum sp.]|jgi:hypothetical protein
MADWKQITARIRRARTSKDPAAQLSNLYEKTQDAMVAFELARHFETAGASADAGKWYVSAAERFRRADWKTKALESAVRLGCEIPAGSLEAAKAEEAAAASKPRSHAARGAKDSADSAEKAKSDTHDTEKLASVPLTMPEPGLPFQQNAEVFESVMAISSEVQAATDATSPPAASATAAESKRRRRGRRGGRNRRKGPATSGAEPAVASPIPAAPRREPARGSGRTGHALPRRAIESSALPEEASSGPGLTIRRPVPPLPVDAPSDVSAPSVKGRYGDPGLSSRLSLLENQFRRLLTCEPVKLDDALGAPVGPGVFVLTDSDLTSYYYVEACQTLRIAVGNLLRGGTTRRGAESIKPQLAEHLGIPEARVGKYLAEHCVVRWLQLDEGASHFAHFVISVLRPSLNE